VVGILLAKILPLDKVKVLPDSMFPCCKSWIKYHIWISYEYFLSGIKFQIEFQGWSFFHPWNIVKFNPWKFISWQFTNDISWMFIHNMEYNLLGIQFCEVHCTCITSPLCQITNPNWLYYFTELQSPHFSNSKVDVAKSPSEDGSFRVILWYHSFSSYLLQFWDN
jgi:hypothetical protein